MLCLGHSGEFVHPSLGQASSLVVQQVAQNIQDVLLGSSEVLVLVVQALTFEVVLGGLSKLFMKMMQGQSLQLGSLAAPCFRLYQA